MLTAAILLAAANCAALPDPDQHAYCRAMEQHSPALEQHSPALCAEIQDDSSRQRCRAELGGGPSGCDNIGDWQQQEMCKAQSKPKD